MGKLTNFKDSPQSCWTTRHFRHEITLIAIDIVHGFRGVSWQRNVSKWVASISFQGKRHYLGQFESLDEAAAARKKAEDELFGTFLRYWKERKP